MRMEILLENKEDEDDEGIEDEEDEKEYEHANKNKDCSSNGKTSPAFAAPRPSIDIWRCWQSEEKMS